MDSSDDFQVVIVSYFFLYILARNAAVRKTLFGEKLLLMNLGLSVLLLLTNGGRGGVVLPEWGISCGV